MKEGGGIWYVHPYAGGPGVGRLGRPYEFARRWQAAGTPAVVFTASRHHLLDRPQPAGRQLISGVPYEFVPTPAYAGNGIGRVLNMLAFVVNFRRRAAEYVSSYGKPRLIIGSSPHPYAFIATHAVARNLGAFSAFEVRDLWPLSLIEWGGIPRMHPFIWATGAVERYAYRNADHVVSLLPKTLDNMISQGLDPKRWHYIPNGADLTACESEPVLSEPLEQMRRWQTQGCFVVVYAGALGRPNNVSTLVKALSQLRQKEGSRTAAIIVGKGDEQKFIRSLVTSLDLADSVGVFDQISKDQAMSLIAEADGGYISLRASDTLRFGVSPNKLFDYMLAGKPVLSAMDDGNEIVTKAGCGFSLPSDDPDALARALQQLSSLPRSDRIEMGKKGRAYALRHHNYDVLAKQFFELLNLPDEASVSLDGHDRSALAK